MKSLAIWVIAVVVLLGALAVATTVLRDTKRIFVVVDSSFPMTRVWGQVSETLDEIDDRRYAEFALATEKSAVHSWEGQLTLARVEAYAPCTFDRIETYTEIQEADELILITTSGSCETSGFDEWQVIFLEP